MADRPGTARRPDSWGLAEGEALTAELTALRLLGGGATYEAYLAFDEITYSIVVAKVLRPSLVADPTAHRALRREVETLAAVNHPVVVRSLRHEYDGPRPHVVLEHVDGPRLSTLIRRYGPLTEQQYLPLAIDVASALHYLRHQQVVHLDIKPSNIIMGSPARLIDLSVARTVPDAAALARPIGTDAYLSPEQADPGGYAGVPSPASDVWGLGATLFEAISGVRPFPEGDPGAATVAEQFPQLAARRPAPDRAPTEVARVIEAMLDPDPASRPLPADVVEALTPVLERQPRARLAGALRG